MDDGNHRRKNNAVLKISLVMLGVLVLLGVIQAVTAGTVGVGALSVTLRDSTTAAPTSTSSSADGGLDGAVGGTTTTTEETTTPSADTKVLTGSWKQVRGLLTVEVTKVETSAGRIRLHLSATNASTAKMDLPIAPITAVDNAGRKYGASLATSKWPVAVNKGSTINGFIDLDQKASANATSVDVTFAGITGQLAPTGGAVTVPGIQLPK
jgi:hypothetical protein